MKGRFVRVFQDIWGWFWGCPGSFLGKPRGEKQVRAGFSGHLGVVLGLSRLLFGKTQG